MTAVEIITAVTDNGDLELTEARTKQAMKEACIELWHSFHLGTDREFELWWRWNMEV
jgi:hypothetical protein